MSENNNSSPKPLINPFEPLIKYYRGQAEYHRRKAIMWLIIMVICIVIAVVLVYDIAKDLLEVISR